MTDFCTQIVRSYEELHCDIETIAKELEISQLEVKAALSQYSKLYRKDTKENRDLDFTDDELEIANNVIVECVKDGDKELAFRAAKYVREDKKGRRDVRNGLRETMINVLAFNEQLRRMHLATTDRKTPALARPETKSDEVIDV